jgi:hypothetical protein
MSTHGTAHKKQKWRERHARTRDARLARRAEKRAKKARLALTQPERDNISQAQQYLETARRACVATADLGVHDCIVHRENVERGFNGHLPLANEAEYHRLHIALGEETCATCPICFTRAQAGLPATVMSSDEKSRTVKLWESRLSEVMRALRVENG